MRFDGTCAMFAAVDVRPLRWWINGIDFTEWPQQHRLPDGKLRPAMVSDVHWQGFGTVVQGLTAVLLVELLKIYPRASSFNPMLSVVMPGHEIDAHRDEQQPEWVCRVHVPVHTNDRALMHIGGETHHMSAGLAYLVDTTKVHSVANHGGDPRVHYMFDVQQSRI